MAHNIPLSSSRPESGIGPDLPSPRIGSNCFLEGRAYLCEEHPISRIKVASRSRCYCIILDNTDHVINEVTWPSRHALHGWRWYELPSHMSFFHSAEETQQAVSAHDTTHTMGYQLSLRNQFCIPASLQLPVLQRHGLVHVKVTQTGACTVIVLCSEPAAISSV